MSKELDALFSTLLQEIADQEKKLPETAPASEEAQRRAEKIAQDVEEDKSWQIPPDPPRPAIPAPQHNPVVVPPPYSHFTDEPSQNPAVRMRDRLEEDALPKPDAERRPNQIRTAKPKMSPKKKKRRKPQSLPAKGGLDMSMPVEKKRKIMHIDIPDELPPDIPREIPRNLPGQYELPVDIEDLLEAVRPEDELPADKREKKVRSHAEQIREQLRLREEEAAEAAVHETVYLLPPYEAPEEAELPEESETYEDDAERTEKKPSIFSKAKVFMTDFLDLNEDDEREEDSRPKRRAPEQTEETEQEKEKVRFADRLHGLKGSFMSRLPQKKESAEAQERKNKHSDGTDWRTLVAPPIPVVPDNPSLLDEEDDDLYDSGFIGDTIPDELPDAEESGDQLAEAYDELEKAETVPQEDEEKSLIPDAIIALLQPGRNAKRDKHVSEEQSAVRAARATMTAEDFLNNVQIQEQIIAPPVPDPETPPVPEPETPEVPDPETPPVPEPETPKLPDPETPPSPAGIFKGKRLRNLTAFDDEDEGSDEDDDPEIKKTAPRKQAVKPERKQGKFASLFREALDESAEELAEMKAEPLPAQGEVRTRFLKRHWYFLAGILSFMLALVGLITTVSWCVNKTQRFISSSSIRNSLEEVLYPVAVVDLPAFEDPSELGAGELLSAAMLDILMYDDLSLYPVTFDVISIPANDVLARAQQRFGTDFTTEFTTLHAAGETFYYDSASGCYNVPSAPSIFSYSPEVTEIDRSGDTYTAIVRYVSDKASWQQHSGNFTDVNTKNMQVTLQKDGDSYQILRIANVSEERK